MANLKKCDFMIHSNELRKCIMEMDRSVKYRRTM